MEGKTGGPFATPSARNGLRSAPGAIHTSARPQTSWIKQLPILVTSYDMHGFTVVLFSFGHYTGKDKHADDKRNRKNLLRNVFGMIAHHYTKSGSQEKSCSEKSARVLWRKDNTNQSNMYFIILFTITLIEDEIIRTEIFNLIEKMSCLDSILEHLA